MDPTFVPTGSEQVRLWAQRRGLGYEPRPNERWFRDWEPFDMLTSPAGYFNACSWNAHPGSATIVEPWTEDGLFEPMDRTIFAFVRHPNLRYRASMRAGEFFVTRVAFLADPPPPEQPLGDAVWDEHVTTRAENARQAQAAFHPRLRELLRRWGFQGHLELRPGGLILYCADLQATPQHYDAMMQRIPEVVNAAMA